MIGIIVVGAEETSRSLNAAAAKAQIGAERFVNLAASYVVAHSRLQFVGWRTRQYYKVIGGEIRRLPKRQQNKGAPSPPDKLGILSGDYKGSISSEIRHVGTSWQADVGPRGNPTHGSRKKSGIFYARFHEFGEGHNPKRPVMEPGLRDALPKIEQELRSLGKDL
jgi:hypothetical protein